MDNLQWDKDRLKTPVYSCSICNGPLLKEPVCLVCYVSRILGNDNQDFNLLEIKDQINMINERINYLIKALNQLITKKEIKDIKKANRQWKKN